MTSQPWPAPSASAPVRGVVAVPGSKSLTNRALLLGALADGPTRVSGALRSRDTDLMVGALRTLGLVVSDEAPGEDVLIDGCVAPIGEATVDCGLAGTVLRFVPPLAALGAARVRFDGDAQARSRPLTPLLAALRGLGVDVTGDRLPFTVAGAGRVRGGQVRLDASASSQFVSGLLLSGGTFDDGLTVVHTGAALPSAPHVAMTVAMLRQAGVDVDDSTPDVWRVAPSVVAPRHWVIEPDLSNAVPFLAAAVVTGGAVTVTGWPTESLQPVTTVTRVLTAFGADVQIADGTLSVTGDTGYGGVDLDLRDIGELTPTVAAMAVLAEAGATSTLRGVAHLRGHETDRLDALTREITGLGGTCEETPDGLRITAAPLHGGLWRSYADHRMATAGALVGLRVPGVAVDDIATTAKTLPRFPAMWAGLLGGGTP